MRTQPSTTETAPRFDMAEVLGASWSVFRSNFVPFTLLSLILNGVIYGIWAYMLAGAQRDFNQGLTGPDPLDGVGAFLAITFGGMLVMMVVYAIVTAGITWGAREQMSARPAPLGAMISVGLSKTLPILVIGLLISLAVIGGIFLFVVPGLMLAMRWAIAIPVLVIEQPDRWMNAMGRSASLTKGYRWQVFGLVIILYVISAIGSTLITGTLGYYDPDDPLGLNAPTLMSPAEIIVQSIFSSLFAAFAAVMFACLYDHLLKLKEGSGLTSIARVFD